MPLSPDKEVLSAQTQHRAQQSAELPWTLRSSLPISPHRRAQESWARLRFHIWLPAAKGCGLRRQTRG